MTVQDRSAARYELLQQIAGGERAAVFHGRDLQRGQPVVIKRFAPGRLPSSAVTQLSATFDTLRRANLQGVVLPLALATTGDEPLAIYPPLAGTSLDVLLLAGFVPSWSGAADIIARCADILAATGKATGLSHRALKPGNIWLAPTGEVLLLDFGIAELGVTAAPPRAGPIFVEYRAPEQLDGAPGDARSDVFALAVLLCELSTGVHPFAGSTVFQVARQLLIGGPPSTSLVTRGMSAAGAREAERLLARSLARAPAERFADAQEFLQALHFARRVIGSPAAPSPAPAAPVRAPKQVVAVVEDPTTMMQLPGPRSSERAAPRAAVPTPVEVPPEPPTLQVHGKRAPVAPSLAAPSAEPARIVAVAFHRSALPPLEERTEALQSPSPAPPPRPLADTSGAQNRAASGNRRISTLEEPRTVEFSRLGAGPTPVTGTPLAERSDDLLTEVHVARSPQHERPAVRPAVEATLILPGQSGSGHAPTAARGESTVIAPGPATTGDRSHKILLLLNVLCVALVLCGLVLMALL